MGRVVSLGVYIKKRERTKGCRTSWRGVAAPTTDVLYLLLLSDVADIKIHTSLSCTRILAIVGLRRRRTSWRITKKKKKGGWPGLLRSISFLPRGVNLRSASHVSAQDHAKFPIADFTWLVLPIQTLTENYSCSFSLLLRHWAPEERVPHTPPRFPRPFGFRIFHFDLTNQGNIPFGF